MYFGFISNILLTIVIVQFSVLKISAQSEVIDEHLTVSMRMIGHRVLLSNGDSTSLVLPVEKDGNIYGIRLATEFEFEPRILQAVIDSVMNESNKLNHYFVSVKSCDSNAIVYSYEKVIFPKLRLYEIDDSTVSGSILPCSNRSYPKDCYEIYISIVDDSNDSIDQIYLTEKETLKSSSQYGIIFLILSVTLFLLVILLVMLFYKRKKSITNSIDFITIGAYHFDTRNTELMLDEEKTELSGKEANLLILLHAHLNTTVAKEEILNKVWGDEGDYVGRTLDVFISKLRKKLEADPSIKIVNIRGVGYKLIVAS